MGAFSLKGVASCAVVANTLVWGNVWGTRGTSFSYILAPRREYDVAADTPFIHLRGTVPTELAPRGPMVHGGGPLTVGVVRRI